MEGPGFFDPCGIEIIPQLGCGYDWHDSYTGSQLAREAEICYAIVAAMTDYDCWHEEDVGIDMIIQNLNKNADNLKQMIKTVILNSGKREANTCICSQCS